MRLCAPAKDGEKLTKKLGNKLRGRKPLQNPKQKIAATKKLYHFLKEIQCLNTSMGRPCLDENWELPPDFDIVNWLMFPNNSRTRVKIGNIRGAASTNMKFTIDSKDIEWPNQFKK
ncbi:Hypothetical predicted protein, partial [Podarcis lilfordi]